MCGATLKAINSYFQKGMTFCCSIYVKKVMKLLAFIFEQPSKSRIKPLGGVAYDKVMKPQHSRVILEIGWRTHRADQQNDW